jgi:hypothetical protein
VMNSGTPPPLGDCEAKLILFLFRSEGDRTFKPASNLG